MKRRCRREGETAGHKWDVQAVWGATLSGLLLMEAFKIPWLVPAKITVMALLQQPTEERMVSTFLPAYVCDINIVSRDR